MAIGIITLPVGALQANCYIINAPGGEAVIIDPGGDIDQIAAACAGLKPELVLLTHGHVDHIAAACAAKSQLGVRVLAHEQDWHFVETPHPYFAQMVGGLDPCKVDGTLEDGQEIAVGEIRLRVLATPGHSLGSVCFLTEGVVFTGDTLFEGSVGRTDLPGGDWGTLMESLRKLIAATTPDTVVYPGHGPATTMGEECRSNPFFAEL